MLKGPRGANAATPTWKQRIDAMRMVPRLIALVWGANPLYTMLMAVLRVVRSVVPVASLWVAKLIVDEVVYLVSHGGGPTHRLWLLVAIEMATVVAGELLARASALVEGLLAELFTNAISIRLMEHAATLDLQQFENPEFHDQLERARQGAMGRTALLDRILSMAQSMLTLGSLSIALIAAAPWLLLLLAIAVIPSFIGETRFARQAYSLLFRLTPQRRELDYVRYLGASDRTAKEVQLFGLAPWLIGRYRTLSDSFYSDNRRLAVEKAIVSSGLSLVGAVGYYSAYVIVLARTVRGDLSIGTMTFLAASFRQSRDLVQGLLLSASGIYEQSLYVRDLFDFFEMRPMIRSALGARPMPCPIKEGFVFDDVGFRYPGSERWAVRHLSFALCPGECVALVGENGAGKTTLTKMLGRLYDPSEGRILLDGVDLREYDLKSLRSAVGVLFQDFVRFDLRFDENIGVGQVGEVGDYLDSAPDAPSTVPPARIATAAEKSLAATLLPRLPGSYRQMLGHRFDTGVELSGGEWQKVALGRAYMRDAQLMILDEPTAALDARAEADVFARFSELMAGRMAVVISHRFSTVRVADRIIVLRGGEIIEQGTHEELTVQGGLYAELFDMQAAGYR